MWLMPLCLCAFVACLSVRTISSERFLTDAKFSSSEIGALFELYIATDGPNWDCCTPRGTKPWNFMNISTANPCIEQWQGVTCTTFDYHVSALSLLSLNLRGTIPTSIKNLTEMTYLDLSENDISSTIPDSIGELTKIKYLYLYINHLTGTIPSSLGNLPRCYDIYLYENCLSGTIPPSLGNDTQLYGLDLNVNMLTGPIPSSFGKLSLMYDILLDTNCLSGSIPSELFHITHLYGLYLESNLLTGTIPSTIGNLIILQDVYFNSNFLSGSIPTSIGGCTILEGIDFEINHLTGTIPTSVGNILQLYFLSLDQNSLTGAIPDSLGGLSFMIYIYLDSNMLTGSIPASVSNMNLLRDFYLSDNRLSGNITGLFDHMDGLYDLYLDNNLLSGTLPSTLTTMMNLNDLYVNNNLLTGTIPLLLGNLPLLQFLNMSTNKLEGIVPSLVNCSSLIEIQLDHNELTGSLDGVFSETTLLSLSIVQINNNHFTGTVPSSIIKLPELNTFVASSNCFHGSLPTAICEASKLSSLVLVGLTSSHSCRTLLLPGLSSSYILDKSVDGALPACLFALPNLTTLHLSGNGFSSTFPDMTIGVLLNDLDISHNDLIGGVDMGIQLTEWTLLDLSFNRISGSLRSDFHSQPYNASLSLTNNRLSGDIPGSLLSMLNISILTSNIFSCDIDGSNLPKHDDGRLNYSCGSNYFNVQYYVWMCMVTVCLVGFYLVWRGKVTCDKSFINVSECVKRWLLVTDPSEKKGVTTATGYDKSIMSPPLQLQAPDGLVVLGTFYSNMFKTTYFCVVSIVFILMPIYVVLTYYFGTFKHQYAYFVSASFLSGMIPFGVVFVSWVCLLCGLLLVFLYVRWPAHSKGEQSAVRSIVVYTVGQTTAVYFALILMNLVVVGGINVGYVYVAIYGSSDLLLVEQFLLSIFKLVWNNICIPGLLNALIRWVLPSSGSTGHKNEVHFLYLQIVISLVNNVFIPLVVVAGVSPNCFYNFFVGAPVVSSTYTVQECILTSTATSNCLGFTPVTATSTFNPQFRYNYQCSSSFITYYAPAFICFCLVNSFMIPMGKYILIHAENPMWENMLPLLLRPPSSEACTTGRIHYNAGRLFVVLSTNLALLLTFGVVFPPLAASFALSLYVILYSSRIEIGRYVCASVDNRKLDCKAYVAAECEVIDFDTASYNVLWLLLWISCLFYALFLFDILGDSVGFVDACWVWVAVPLLPVGLYGVETCFKRVVGAGNSQSNVSTHGWNRANPSNSSLEMTAVTVNPVVERTDGVA